MDNLAHSFVGALVGSALVPELAAKHRRRMLLGSAALAQWPDIDILIALLGSETYIFHHRGFTHSILGLALMVPLGLAIFSRIMGKERLSLAGAKANYAAWAFFVLVQLVVCHFFLDYLTSYGTLFLYPFSWQRFSFPLMFIIDPSLWLIAGTGFCLLFFRKKLSAQAVAKTAWGSLAAILALWSFELGMKRHIEGQYQARQASAVSASPERPVPASSEQITSTELYSIPAPFAPLFWTLLEKQWVQKEGATSPEPHYKQAAISYISKDGYGVPHWWQEEIPASLHHGMFCSEGHYEAAALESFTRYARWAEHFVCSPYEWKGQAGCRCFSLKYSLAALGQVGYGAYWVSESGTGGFLPGVGREALVRNYMEFIALPGQ